jgi:hypothetical protein
VFGREVETPQQIDCRAQDGDPVRSGTIRRRIHDKSKLSVAIGGKRFDPDHGNNRSASRVNIAFMGHFPLGSIRGVWHPRTVDAKHANRAEVPVARTRCSEPVIPRRSNLSYLNRKAPIPSWPISLTIPACLRREGRGFRRAGHIEQRYREAVGEFLAV